MRSRHGVQGGNVGFATVVETKEDSTNLQIVRQWQSHHSGSWIVENPNSLFALQLTLNPPINSYFNCGVQFHAASMHWFDFGLGLQFIRLTDSYDDNDWGFGFSGFGIWRFLNSAKFNTGVKLGLALDIPFRKDDDDQTVNAGLFSIDI